MNQKIRSFKVTGEPRRRTRNAAKSDVVSVQEQYADIVNDLARLESELIAEGKLPGEFTGTNLSPLREFGENLRDKPSRMENPSAPQAVFGAQVPRKPEWTSDQVNALNDIGGSLVDSGPSSPHTAATETPKAVPVPDLVAQDNPTITHDIGHWSEIRREPSKPAKAKPAVADPGVLLFGG